MKKKVTLISALLAAACVFASSAVYTVSYISDREQIVNSLQFIGDDGLNAILSEPGWNPQYGLLTLPNSTIVKDPQITNTSQQDFDELVSVRLEFVYSENCPDAVKAGQLLSEQDMAYVTDVYEIDYNADDPAKKDWVRFSNEDKTNNVQTFYYKKTLERNYPGSGETTVPLFTNLSINKTVNNEEFSHIQDIGGFDIRISGYVIQQISGDTQQGLNSAADAYNAGLFTY